MGFDDFFPVLIEDNKIYRREQLKFELNNFLNSDELEWLDERGIVSAVDQNETINYSNIEATNNIY